MRWILMIVAGVPVGWPAFVALAGALSQTAIFYNEMAPRSAIVDGISRAGATLGEAKEAASAERR